MNSISLFPATAALAAALSMAATPAFAADHSLRAADAAVPGYAVWNADSENVQRDRYRGRYHRNRVGTGDVIGGLLVIGAIAAVANSVARTKEARSYPAPYPSRSRDYRGNSRYTSAQGIDRAADLCVREIERDVRVDSVDTISRSGDGWLVSGVLYNGDGFTCRVGRDGRIDDVSYGERSAQQSGYSEQDDRQWSDDRYAAARGNADRTAPGAAAIPAAPESSGQVPPYPGGPVPGEDYEEYPEAPAGQDDRYGG